MGVTGGASSQRADFGWRAARARALAIIGGFVTCAISPAGDVSAQDEAAQQERGLLASYIESTATRASFDYDAEISVNVRVLPTEESAEILADISRWYKEHSEIFKLTNIEKPRQINILVLPDVIKHAKAGAFPGLASDFANIDAETSYCFVEAINDDDAPGFYRSAAILIDPVIKGDLKACLADALAPLFGFETSLRNYVGRTEPYARYFDGNRLDAAQKRAFAIRKECRETRGTPEFGNCIMRAVSREDRQPGG